MFAHLVNASLGTKTKGKLTYMRPDQSRSVDYSKEYSSKANNRLTRMLTAGTNGIARDSDLYPTFETESSIKITIGVINER